jgi:hypothetical protein
VTIAQQFVDCSSNNPLPDLAAYKAAGHRHLCRKVSEGIGYHWFEGDRVTDRAHAAGLRVGHYHWLRPDSSATAQAAFFVTNLAGHLKSGDWLMTDFERTADAPDPADGTLAAHLHEFNSYVRQHLPNHPLYVYTGNWYLAGKPDCQAECRRWPIVMSDYSGVEHLPNPYSLHYVAWQFTDRAKVAGFSAPVDYNRWLVTPTQEFTMTPIEEAKIASMIDARAEKTEAMIRNLFIGHDQKVHRAETLDIMAGGHSATQARAAMAKMPGYVAPA